MNCEDIALFMDDRDVNGLDQAQSKLVHAHLEKCAQCAAEWDAYARVLAAPLDAMRPELRRDVRQAVVESVAAGRGRGRYLRPMLLGLLVAGAAAAMFALAPDLGENASTVARNGGGVVPTQLQAAQGPSTAVAPFEGSVDGPTRGDGVAAAGGGRERLVMLPTRHETSNQTAIDGINATHAAFVRFLRERTDLEVIELLEQEEAGVPVSISFLRVVRWLITLGRSNEQDRARDVARHYGASYLVRFASELPIDPRPGDDRWSFDVRWWLIPGERERRSGGGNGGTLVEPAVGVFNPEASGVHWAQRIYSSMFPERSQALFTAMIADARLSDDERLQALRQANQGVRTSNEVVAAAIDLARSSPNPQTRSSVWGALGRTAHPAVAQPLVDALLTDGDAGVRRVAAEGLRNHLRDPSVRAALESAAAGDRSPDVRLQARWMLMSASERRALVDSALRDRSLPPEERIAPFMILQRDAGTAGLSANLAADAAELIVETARASDDPAVKAAAIRELEPDPRFVEFLIEQLGDGNAGTRRRAVSALLPFHRDVPGVVEAVERMRTSETDQRLRDQIDRQLR